MSEAIEADVVSCCASCGKAEIDDIKLVPCDDCGLVKYCSDECLNEHKSEHEEECKKRAAELRDELLFKQPESSHLGDCPICCLPMRVDGANSLKNCCCKIICGGCEYAHQKQQFKQRLIPSCPFCRKPVPKTEEECHRRRKKRVQMNDPVAMCQEGVRQYDEGDYRSAFEYFTKAAKLGDAYAHLKLAMLYHEGEGIEKDDGKAIHHLEEAALGGHPGARQALACEEYINGNIERAVKHWIISATQGEDESTKMLMKAFKKGYLEKDVLAAVLRAHKAAVDTTKSAQRKEAAEYLANQDESFI